jgi:hypothetical protein
MAGRKSEAWVDIAPRAGIHNCCCRLHIHTHALSAPEAGSYRQPRRCCSCIIYYVCTPPNKFRRALQVFMQAYGTDRIRNSVRGQRKVN